MTRMSRCCVDERDLWKMCLSTRQELSETLAHRAPSADATAASTELPFPSAAAGGDVGASPRGPTARTDPFGALRGRASVDTFRGRQSVDVLSELSRLRPRVRGGGNAGSRSGAGGGQPALPTAGDDPKAVAKGADEEGRPVADVPAASARRSVAFKETVRCAVLAANIVIDIFVTACLSHQKQRVIAGFSAGCM